MHVLSSTLLIANCLFASASLGAGCFDFSGTYDQISCVGVHQGYLEIYEVEQSSCEQVSLAQDIPLTIDEEFHELAQIDNAKYIGSWDDNLFPSLDHLRIIVRQEHAQIVGDTTFLMFGQGAEAELNIQSSRTFGGQSEVETSCIYQRRSK